MLNTQTSVIVSEMTEVLPRSETHDPMSLTALYERDMRERSVYEEARLFKNMIEEGAQLESKRKVISGPFFPAFREVLEMTDKEIKTIDPTLTGEHCMPLAYQSTEVRRDVELLSAAQRKKLYAIRFEKVAALKAMGSEVAYPELRQQGIPTGSLDATPYVKQQDDWKHTEGVRGCTNACFRMVYGAITGEIPTQTALSQELMRQYNTSVVDDSIHGNLYRTETFRREHGKSVSSCELIGTDFGHITSIASRLKASRPGLKVYCTANIVSNGSMEGTWHTCVLLSAENGVVTYHDPSATSGGERKTASYEEFARRWAVTYNRAVLTIAA